jgi:hypothetical protein
MPRTEHCQASVKVQLIRDETSSTQADGVLGRPSSSREVLREVFLFLTPDESSHDERKVSTSALCHKVKLPVTQDKSRNVEFAIATFELGRPAEVCRDLPSPTHQLHVTSCVLRDHLFLEF